MNARTAIMVIGCVCALAVRADNRYMTANDASAPTSSFNTGANWDNKEKPCAGNDYFTAGNSMRTPDGGSVNDTHIFEGDSLTVNGGALAWKSAGTVTVSNLIFRGGNLAHWQGGLAQDARLFGNIEVPAGFSCKFQCTESENDNRFFRIHSAIRGAGTLEMEMGNSNYVAHVKGVELLGDNSGFSGRTVLRGFGKFMIPAEEALGVPLAAFTVNHLELNGATLSVTNSLTLDDPTRGILLNNVTLPSSQRYPWGVFEVSGTNMMTVACVIAGEGALIKRGSGTLLLATNNTYTGVTRVEAGTLRFDPEFDALSATVEVAGATAAVAGEGTLGTVTLSAGGTLLAEAGGWDVANMDAGDGRIGIDLSSADPDVARVRVNGALTKQAFGAFVVTAITNGARMGVTYQVLTAPNLAEFRDVDFCVHPPWLGTLSREGTALLFTPTFPEDIAFKTLSDPMNDTGFTNANWTTGLPPEAGKTYVSQSREMRLPPGGDSTFAGDRVIMDNQNISLKNPTGIATIADLTMMNNASVSMTEHGNSRLAGRILLHPVLDAGRNNAMHIDGWSNHRSLHLFADLAGYGRLTMEGGGDPKTGVSVYNFLGDNADYFGAIDVRAANSNFWIRVSCASSLGGALPAFRSDALTFNGGGLGATNDVTLADPNRGITLSATGSTGRMSNDSGSYPTNSITLGIDRSHPGGGFLRAEEADVTLTVDLPITGAGSLSTVGPGTVVLGGGNSYTGLTSVLAGTLRVTSPNALGTGPLIVKAGATLEVPYPSAAMPEGVALGEAPVFEDGARVTLALASGYTVDGNSKVPLFLFPTGTPLDPAAVPFVSTVEGYAATVSAETMGGSVLVSASFRFTGGTVLMVQ